MSMKYNESQLKEAKEIFKLFDTNGDNKISASEIGDVLRSMGDDPTEDEVQEMLKENDLDSNGEIDFDEFLQTMAPRFLDNTGDYSNSAKEIFQSFDKDGDGYIVYEELSSALNTFPGGFSDEEVKEMFDKIQNGGKITFDAFNDIVKKALA